MTRLDGEPERALPYARAAVAADPLSEAAHGKLVALLAALVGARTRRIIMITPARCCGGS